MTSFFKFFSRIQSFTARVPAMFFLISYVAIIPVFALYYSSVAAEFYHSTAKYEANILGDGSQLRQDLEAAVRDQFLTANGENIKEVDGWLLDIRQFSISKASFQDGRLYFQAYMRSLSNNGMMIGGPRGFYIDAGPSFVVGGRGAEDRIVVKIPHSDEERHWPVPDSEIFSTTEVGFARTARGAIAIPSELQERITSLQDSFDGFPARSSGAFGRLLYFSAVTQTTLGFGDIVPISDRTRLVVGIQSVLGIILIGLFLNSLAGARSSGP